MKKIYLLLLTIFMIGFFISNSFAGEGCSYIEGQIYDSVLYKVYSADSSKLYSIVEKNGKAIFKIDDRELMSFDEIDIYSFRLSSIGDSYAFIGIIDGKQQIIKDGKDIFDKAFIDYYIVDLKYSDNGLVFSYIIEDNEGIDYEIINGKKIKTTIDLGEDGEEGGYTTVFEDYTDGIKLDGYNKPFSLEFSSDFSKLGFIVNKDNKEYIVQQICNNGRTEVLLNLHKQVEKLYTLKNPQLIILNVGDFFYDYINNIKILNLIETKLLSIKSSIDKERSKIIYDYILAKVKVYKFLYQFNIQ